MTENLDGGVAASIDATYAIRQPAEYCGHELTGLVHTDRWTECVLRPGHQGSHASHEGARWIERPADGYCPHCGRGDAGPTADQYERQRQRADKAEIILSRLGALTGAHKDSDQITIGELTAALERREGTPDA